ncbi:MAG: hypothetical protein DMF96_10245 [Acidobacteria bacterium]|nr:MAG: hypothetical protein DMF96_10245 [Acidobacteriota bacterium]
MGRPKALCSVSRNTCLAVTCSAPAPSRRHEPETPMRSSLVASTNSIGVTANPWSLHDRVGGDSRGVRCHGALPSVTVRSRSDASCCSGLRITAPASRPFRAAVCVRLMSNASRSASKATVPVASCTGCPSTSRNSPRPFTRTVASATSPDGTVTS